MTARAVRARSRRAALRRRQLAAALPVLGRSVRWQPVAAVAIVAPVLLWWRAGDLDGGAGAVWLLRAVALLLAAAVPFALDDRSRGTVAASPTPLSVRSAAVLLVVIVPASLVWAAACTWVVRHAAQPVPVAGLTAEAAGIVAAMVAVALGLARWRDVTDPGAAVAPLVVGLGFLLPQLPSWATLVPLPGPDWSAAHLRWAGLLAGAIVLCGAAVSDPGRSRRRPLTG